MLRVESICKKLGNFQLQNINLQIEKSEYFVILGPTGTGKTVILEVLAGMYKPDNGLIFFDEKNLTNLYPEEREIGFVYQDYVLFPHLTVKENILFGLKTKKYPKNKMNQKLNEIVEMFQIEYLLERHPGTLSGGEQQRVAIARALITSPKLLLMDEPLSALDPHTKEIFQQMLKEIHKKTKTTTIHITHDFNEALYLADRIAVMHNGKIVQVGTPNEVFRRPNSDFVAQFVGVENILKGNMMNRKVRLSERLEIQTLVDKTGDVTLALRPEDVIICKDPSESYNVNKFKGKVTDIIQQGLLCKLYIDIGEHFISRVPTKMVENMNIHPGDTVWATFEDSAVHVF